MTRPTVREYDAADDSTIDRLMSDSEFTQYQKDVEEAAARELEVTKTATAKAALLKRLGITADEAALLLS